ncbi:hypothetical protein K501DRAFT_269027 [Backusella circina FSU 941]|nr:hypothetical protein K501DRAFT_269027 [Backusella circina FSU 941]
MTKSRFSINNNSNDSDTSGEFAEDSNGEETKRASTGNGVMFSNLVRTYGHTIDFIFCRKKRAVKITSGLQLDDFTKEKVVKYYSLIYLDSGRKQVFAAVTGNDLKNNERSLDKGKINSNVKKMKTDISTGKTANVIKYEKYIRYMLSNLTSLFQFYDPNGADVRFRRFQGYQRIREEKVNILINDGKSIIREGGRKRRQTTTSNEEDTKKHEKKQTSRKFSEGNDYIPLVVSGAGMFGKDQVKFKGLQRGLAVDECRTSRVYCSCKNDTLKVSPIVKGYGVLKLNGRSKVYHIKPKHTSAKEHAYPKGFRFLHSSSVTLLDYVFF